MNQRHARQLLAFTNCFYCKRKLGMGEEYTHVIKAVLPPRTRNRWDAIGKACIDCEDKQTTFHLGEPIPC